MEEITMERLLTNFNEVVNEFRQLVDNKDIAGVKKALSEVEGLLAKEQGIELDRPEDTPFDHVLHHFLGSIGGFIEKEQIIPGTPDITLIEIEEYRARIQILLEERIQIENEIRALDGEEEITVDGSIEKRIAEIEAEIARRLEAWENTLQYTENAEANKEAYDKGTEKLRAELENLKAQLKIVNQSPNKKTEDFEKRIAEIEAEIARRLEAWENTLQYTENAEANKEAYDKGTDRLRVELEKLKTELENAKIEQKPNNVKDNSAEIAELKAAIERAYEELELAKNGKPSPANSQWRLDLVDHIDLLKRKLAALENVRNTEGPSDQEPSERKKVLLERLTLIDVEIYDLTVKITEIEGRDTVVNKETFDVNDEVNRIGDKVFKTAEIRRELAERNVSREEFLHFYKERLSVSEANIPRLLAAHQKFVDGMVVLFIDRDSDKSLLTQLGEVNKNGDDAQRILVYEKIRKNLIAQGYDDDVLKNEIKTKEDADNMSVIVEQYLKGFREEKNKIELEIQDQQFNKDIFIREIDIIEKEQENLNLLDENDGLEAKAEREKQLRARQIKATMFGDEELEKEYDERFKRFYEHKITLRETYIDENGEEQELYYDSIKDYPQYEEDAFFLNLEDYKRSLETVTKYRNSDNDLYALGEDFVKILENQPEKEKAIKAYEEKLRQAEEYVDTFHGHTNKYKVKYENYKNAGSTLKGMVPVKDLPPLQKVATTTENIFRFFGLRKPEFTKYDETGKKVKDIKGGLMTLGVDALVVGGVAAAGIFGGPVGLATVGTAYAAKGLVTAGNLVAAGITKSKHGADIEDNRPTPYSVTKDDKEVARKDYYRKSEGLGPFESWLKAKNDRWLFKNRAKETEDKIVELEIKNAEGRIDSRTAKAMADINENARKADENQRKRQENYVKISKSKETYNDIVRDPDSVNKEETASIIAQNAAVRSFDGVGRDVNPNSQEKNTHQYVKQDPDLENTEKLGDVVIQGGTTAATAITEEEKYTARQQKQDRMNRVATIILTVAGKIGIDFAKGKFIDQITKYKQGPDTITKEPIYGDKEVTEVPDKLTDLKLKSEALDNIYDGDTTSYAGDIVSTGNAETMSDPVAVGIRYVTDEGKEIGVSIAENGSGLTTTHPHVNLLADGTLKDKSLIEVIDLFKQMNPTDGSGSFAEILSQPEFAGKTSEEIAKILVEKDALWLQNSSLGGWQNADHSKLTTIAQEIIGYKDVIIPGPQIPYTVDVINYRNIFDAAIVGSVAGLGITTADTLHEAAHQTKKRVPGEFDVKNPTYQDGTTIMDLIEKRQKELNKQRENEKGEERE